MTRAAVSWSGGKDSCLALLRAADLGLRIDALLTMADPDGLSKSHALPQELIAAQAQAMGLELRWVVAAIDQYGSRFGAALDHLRADGYSHLVFGDIDLQAHRDWLEPACRAAGLEPVFPLWNLLRAEIAREVIQRGIHALVVCVDERWLDASSCGASYDEVFLAGLPAGVCPCGEEGEFHTFVWDAPCLSHPLSLKRSAQRREKSSPPFAPTSWVFQTLSLAKGSA
jgi:diphthine-ammonia ligase